MLGLFGKLKIYHPGGCDFGKRPIDYHLASLKQLGVEIDEDEIIDLKFNNIKPTTFVVGFLFFQIDIVNFL